MNKPDTSSTIEITNYKAQVRTTAPKYPPVSATPEQGNAHAALCRQQAFELLYSLADILLKASKINPLTLGIEFQDDASTPPGQTVTRSAAKVMQDARDALEASAQIIEDSYGLSIDQKR